MSTPTKQVSPSARQGLEPTRPGAVGRIESAQNPKHALLRLLPFLRPFGLRLTVVFAGVIAYTLFGLAGPYLMGVAIDRFIGPGQSEGLLQTVLWMLLVYLLANGFQVATAWLMSSISQQALQTLRRDLFAHIQRLPLKFFDHLPAGELMSRLTNDIDAVNQTVSQNVTTLLAGVLSLGGILIAMFVLDYWLALASVLVVPVIIGFTRFVAGYTRKGYRDLQERLGNLNAVTEEAIGGQKVVKAFGRNDSVLAAFRKENERVYQAGVYANNYSMLLMPVTGVLGNFFVIILAGLGGWLALRGLVSIGVIATFISYGQNFIQPLRLLANIYNSIQAALAGAERIFEILDTPPEIDEGLALPKDGIRGAVCFEGVGFGYEPGHPVVREMNLAVAAGQTIALVGPTGAGKSTIMNLLTRFYEIDSGRITLDGRDLRAIAKSDLRRCIGLVPQDTFLFAESVLENIRFGRLDASDQECVEAAKMADADHFIRQLPQGYHTDLAERAGNLSQGQRQLLAIARAILARPLILILDEATSSVDTRTEARIQQALLRVMDRQTSFVIAHRLSTIRDADLVVVIEEGRIVEQGTHQHLLQRRGVYHHLYTSQFKGKAI
ncbi:ABC transporter ATP-binding protein [uncultured Desulfobulbus sp.]|uniref:ABC transporter ATP-binding protein n=1 Tax=uncultured Desulfobulbus sp. TaxID=239745 RepID=UPI0029C7AF30|nr:ABC transporter ATP-binding protein [uncultured Desulfobulbus sp.]